MLQDTSFETGRRLRLPDRDVVRISLDIPDDLAQGLAEQGHDLRTDLNARIRGVDIGPEGEMSHSSAEPSNQSLRRAIVIVKQTAQPSTSTNATNGPVRRRRARDQCVLDPLVIPLVVIVRDVFGDCPSKMPLAERNQPIEALLIDRAHEALGVGIRIGARDTARAPRGSPCRRARKVRLMGRPVTRPLDGRN
jgi:hypothetical protein